MNKSKSYIGYWWLPGHEDRKIHGTLTMNANSAFVLQTLEKFKDIDFYEYFANQREFELIIGIAREVGTNSDYSFKLLNSFIVNNSVNTLTFFKIEIGSILKTNRIELSEKLEFNVLTLKPQYIDEWFGLNGYDLVFQDDKNYQLTYTQPNEIILFSSELFKIKAYFAFRYGFIIKPEFNSKQSAFINIYFSKGQSIDVLKVYSKKIRDFFTFAMGTPINHEYFEVRIVKNNEEYPNYNFKYYQKDKFKQQKDKSLSSRSMLFDFEYIKNETQNIFKNWFSKNDEVKFTFNNFFGTLYNDFLYTEDKFLNYVFALEVFHRNRYQSFNLKNKNYLEKRENILKCITNKSDKEWLEARLNKIIENRLETRLENLLYIHKISLEGLIKDSGLFIKKIVETRHFYVHENVLNEQYVVENLSQLARITSKLRIILQAVLMFEIGIEPDKINERLKNSGESKFLFNN